MKQMLITAGPTHQPIDAVRYIANRSSGRMGIAIAAAARDAGWDVTLLLGPVSHAPPERVRVEHFGSTDDLQRLLDRHFPRCDVLVMAAAVADYRPVNLPATKIARGAKKLVLELAATPDLVGALAAQKKVNQRIVGFALDEAARLNERAKQKLREKKLDAIVANPLETMGAESIDAKVFTADGVFSPPQGGSMDKKNFAEWLVEWIERSW